jgi:Ni2+-binding GTPase involved in maturation of urease and hydrogenase
MRIALVGGPSASGKTSVLRHALRPLVQGGLRLHLVKFDCVAGSDAALYATAGIPATIRLAQDICPDHHFVQELGEEWLDAEDAGAELLIAETAGLCDRCSPFLRRAGAVCVLPLTASLHAPARLRAQVTTADLVVLTRGELVSQAEREVFKATVEALNPAARIFEVNGLTGEGSGDLGRWLDALPSLTLLNSERLRYAVPRGDCGRCTGGM